METDLDDLAPEGRCSSRILRRSLAFGEEHIVDIVSLCEKREWVGLTAAERRELWMCGHSYDHIDQVENKLKDKNK